MTEDLRRANKETQQVWNQNAAFWDERMGEGNHFVEVLIWPATERLLELRPGERVLDIACGNGLSSRRLAALGAHVVAFDFAEEMIAFAQERTAHHAELIDYRVLDATDEAALLSLGEEQFDAAICNMALFDMADIQPLMRVLIRMLRSGGRFVFSVLHPCFNGSHITQVAEQEERDGEFVTTCSVKVTDYIRPSVAPSAAMRDQPRPHLVFHRPLFVLFGACIQAGFVLDGLEEPVFPPNFPVDDHLISWRHFSQIPPVLVARMRC
jgi:2-polyprenyl-3-methyl-5-hydroxy-6-metoxy-1,4-benzoquinol methylase